MKKILAIILAMVMVFSLAACGDPDSGNSGGKKNSSKDNGLSVKQCVTQLLNAKSEEDIAEVVVDNYDGYAETILEMFPDDDYTVTVKKLGTHDGYEFYSYSVKQVSDSDFTREGIEVFVKTDDGYKIANNPEKLEELVSEVTCGTCNGSGSVISGSGNTCGICGGTGVQYYPNSYYDATLQMWMGETRACSGCGGAGNFGSTTTSCGTCGGCGLHF